MLGTHTAAGMLMVLFAYPGILVTQLCIKSCAGEEINSDVYCVVKSLISQLLLRVQSQDELRNSRRPHDANTNKGRRVKQTLGKPKVYG